MKKILDLIKEALLWLGVESEIRQNIIGVLTIIAIAIFIGKHVWSIIQYFLKRRRNKLLAKDLHPYFTSGEVRKATKYYIDTRYQNVPPSQDEEPGRSYIAAARQLLIPLFLKNAFKNEADDTKYYLVLADSGMGKTTFMINLYLAYKYKRVWFWQRPKHEILLLPMGHPDTMNTLKEMPSSQKRNTILLLDAFDEDNKAVNDYKNRLDELLNIVWEFREIVITCRTQFFPSSKEEPSETGQFKYGGEGGEYIFQKVYVSVFSENDIKKYLRKRYKSFWFYKSAKYKNAFKVVSKSPNLMMRPMLLSQVEDLIYSGVSIDYGYQVYELLIDKWLDREANKAGIKDKYKDRDYKMLLLNFSKALAIDLYINRKIRQNKLSIGINEIIDNPNGLQLKDIEGNSINIDKYDQSSRSLLNRNAIGEYKFSHKSILEYFIALVAFENMSFFQKFNFDADLDTVKLFFLDFFQIKKPDYLKHIYDIYLINSNENFLFNNIYSVVLSDFIQRYLIRINFDLSTSTLDKHTRFFVLNLYTFIKINWINNSCSGVYINDKDGFCVIIALNDDYSFVQYMFLNDKKGGGYFTKEILDFETYSGWWEVKDNMIILRYLQYKDKDLKADDVEFYKYENYTLIYDDNLYYHPILSYCFIKEDSSPVYTDDFRNLTPF